MIDLPVLDVPCGTSGAASISQVWFKASCPASAPASASCTPWAAASWAAAVTSPYSFLAACTASFAAPGSQGRERHASRHWCPPIFECEAQWKRHVAFPRTASFHNFRKGLTQYHMHAVVMSRETQLAEQVGSVSPVASPACACTCTCTPSESTTPSALFLWLSARLMVEDADRFGGGGFLTCSSSCETQFPIFFESLASWQLQVKTCNSNDLKVAISSWVNASELMRG